MQPPVVTAQLNQALEERLQALEHKRNRLLALLYNGHFVSPDQTVVLAQFTDMLETHDTFTLHPGETLAQALARLDAKWAAHEVEIQVAPEPRQEP